MYADDCLYMPAIPVRRSEALLIHVPNMSGSQHRAMTVLAVRVDMGCLCPYELTKMLLLAEEALDSERCCALSCKLAVGLVKCL